MASSSTDERTLLLPRHRVVEDDETQNNDLDISTQRMRARPLSSSWMRRMTMRYYHVAVLAIVVVSLGMAARWVSWRPPLQENDEASTNPVVMGRSDMHNPKTLDAHIEQWGEWKRQMVPPAQKDSFKKPSLFHQHMELAQQIINWEEMWDTIHTAWDDAWPTIESTWKTKVATKENVDKVQQEATKQGKAAWNKVATKENVEKVKQEAEKQGKAAWKNVMTKENMDKAKQEAQKQWDAFLSNTKGAIMGDIAPNNNNNNTLLGAELEPWFHNMSDWFQQTWTTFAHDAHEVWLQMKAKAGEDGKLLWNATVETERIWYANSITNMHRLGDNLQSWWKDTEAEMVQDEAVLQERFKRWWDKMAERERIWWKQSRVAFHNFTDRAKEKEQLWWNMVKESSKRGWNQTKMSTVHAWETTKAQTRAGWNATEHGVEAGAKAAWNSTVTTEEHMWHAIQKWFQAHATYTEELSQPIVYLNTTVSYGMLMNGYGWYDFSNDFFLLQQGWDAQINQAYCAVAANAAVLNSLRGLVDLPIDPIYEPHPYATQTSLLLDKETNECVNTNVVRYNESFDGVLHSPGGLSLHQASQLLQCHLPSDEWQVTTHHIEPNAVADLDEFRKNLSRAMRDPMTRVIVNFDRQVLGQEGGGHFSPLASYYETEDRFLIMDVAKYKYPAAWVPAARLYASLATVDYCGKSKLLPAAQDSLPPGLPPFDNKTALMKQLKELGCEQTYRGYILVRRITQ